MADEYLSIDLDNLRVREIEDIEEIMGVPFDQAFAADKPKGKVLRAIGYVVKRRDNPDFTIDDAGELIVQIANGTEPDPTAG